jgi:hypothetical protein
MWNRIYVNRAATLLLVGICLTLASSAEARQSRLVAPVITAVAPQPLVARAAPQRLTITGSNFRSGLSLSVAAPDGRKQTYAGPAILARGETSFEVALILAARGPYTLIVTNPEGGGSSDQFVVRVQPAASRAAVVPRIAQVLPAPLTKDPRPQVINIRGDRFVRGLSVYLTSPIGMVFEFKGTSLSAVTESSISLSVVLDMTGDYAVLVTNPSGESSNSVTVSVIMGAGITK